MSKYHIEQERPSTVKPKYKKICQACVTNYDKLTPAEKSEAFKLNHPVQMLFPCCPRHMIIKCSCGQIEEKFPLEVVALWIRTASIDPDEAN